MIKILLAVAAGVILTASVNGQDYRIQRMPYGGGYDVYDSNGLHQQTIREQPYSRGNYDVYGNDGLLQQQIRRQPYGNGGYDVHTMPSYRHW